MSKGIDIGTMNLVCAKQNKGGEVVTQRLRDAFLDLPASSRKLLRLSGANFVEQGDKKSLS